MPANSGGRRSVQPRPGGYLALGLEVDHPALAVVELGTDEVVHLLEGGVVVVHVFDDEPLGVGAEQVPLVLFELLGEVPGVLDVGLAADGALQQDNPVDVELVSDQRRMSRS